MSKPWPRAILFDLDNTLWPIAPLILDAEERMHAWLQEHAPRVAARLTIERLREARLSLLAQQPDFRLDLSELRRLGPVGLMEAAEGDADKLERSMVEFFVARNAVVPYDDVLLGLVRLKGRVALGALANGNPDLQAIGLSHHFRVALVSHQAGMAKPDAAFFQAACRALGVAPGETVYVGDELQQDVAGAQRAGLRGVWMNRSHAALPKDAGVTPDAIVADCDQLLEWLSSEYA